MKWLPLDLQTGLVILECCGQQSLPVTYIFPYIFPTVYNTSSPNMAYNTKLYQIRK